MSRIEAFPQLQRASRIRSSILLSFGRGMLFYYSVVAYYDFVGEGAREIFASYPWSRCDPIKTERKSTSPAETACSTAHLLAGCRQYREFLPGKTVLVADSRFELFHRVVIGDGERSEPAIERHRELVFNRPAGQGLPDQRASGKRGSRLLAGEDAEPHRIRHFASDRQQVIAVAQWSDIEGGRSRREIVPNAPPFVDRRNQIRIDGIVRLAVLAFVIALKVIREIFHSGAGREDLRISFQRTD